MLSAPVRAADSTFNFPFHRARVLATVRWRATAGAPARPESPMVVPASASSSPTQAGNNGGSDTVPGQQPATPEMAVRTGGPRRQVQLEARFPPRVLTNPGFHWGVFFGTPQVSSRHDP